MEFDSMLNATTASLSPSKQLLIFGLVSEIHAQTGASKKMILVCALAVIAHAAQACYQIHVPGKGMCRLSLACKVVANSGLMKTLILDLLTRCLRNHQDEGEKKYDEASEKHSAELDIWTIYLRSLSSELKKTIKEGGDTSGIEKAIHAHHANKPRLPTKPTMLKSDATNEALFQDHPSVFLALSEATLIYDARRYPKFAPLAVEMYSGSQSHSTDRKSSGRISYANKFLTTLFFSQEHITYGFLDRHGELANALGEIPRSSCCIVEDDRGYRDCPPQEDVGNACHEAFDTMLKVLYEKSDRLLVDPDNPLETLYLSPEADKVRLSLQQNIEQKMASGGPLEKYKAAASRICENAVRVAGCLHVSESRCGPIDANSMSVAIEIVRWFFHDYLQLVTPKASAARNANLLYDWFNRVHLSDGKRFIPLSRLSTTVTPKYLRSADAKDPALRVLLGRGDIKLFKCGDTTMIDMQPNFYFDQYKAADEIFKEYGITGTICCDPNNITHPLLRMGVEPRRHPSIYDERCEFLTERIRKMFQQKDCENSNMVTDIFAIEILL